MTTSATKTRALCVATRCTSVEQFVATFHRFCGDDETFFVATMTSRPIGLETPFSIQLADKQPVLRGLCIVLDAWETPENRYKRPGIRLGIKRLTAESQIVFERLKAAAKAPDEIAEASPPPGPLPVPPRAAMSRDATMPLSAIARPPAFPLRAAATPPPLPPLIGPRTGPPVRAATATPSPVLRAPAIEPRRPRPDPKPPAIPHAPAPEPPAATARPLVPAPPVFAPPVLAPPVLAPPVLAPPVLAPPVLAPPVLAPPVLAPPVLAPPVLAPPVAAPPVATPPVAAPPLAEPAPSEPPTLSEPEAAAPPVVASHPARRLTPPPIAVTRFQVALNVDALPPSIEDFEFKPTHLVRRKRAEPRVASEPAPDEVRDEPGKPAMIIDRPVSAEPPEPHESLPSLLAQISAAAPELPALPVPDLRTPGSSFVLPANPLHDLSDESLEGFVDCTLYEETANFFHPTIDGGEWNDEAADPPAAPLTSRPAPPASVPAMPFDTPPNLMVRAHGESESLRFAPDEPPPPPPPWPDAGPAFTLSPTDALFAPLHERAASATPWLESASAVYRNPPPPDPGFASDDRSTPSLTPIVSHGDPNTHMLPFPTMDATGQARYTAPHPAASSHAITAQTFPPSRAFAAAPDASDASAHPQPQPRQTAMTRQQSPLWHSWAIIGGTAIAAIVIAFVIARMIRGPAVADRPPVAAAAAPTPPRSAAPAPLPALHPGSGQGNGPGSGQGGGSTLGSGQTVARDPRPAARSEPAGNPTPPPELQPDDEGEAVAGGTPVVGSGPCKLTIATTPAGSIVRVDDQPVGPSPISVEGSCDKHKVDVAHARYQAVSRWVTLAAGKPQALDINLPRPIHAVTVTSFPPGAELSIDGHRAGTTPTVVQMMGFATVNLTFTKPGFQSVTKKVYSKLPQDRVFVKLMK